MPRTDGGAASDGSRFDITCHPSACTPGLCLRGDIAPLSNNPATQPLLSRLLNLDCSPHSIPPLQIFAEANPVTNKSLLFQYYLLDSTGFQPSVFTTKIKNRNDDPSTQMIHDLRVAPVDRKAKEHPAFGMITFEDAERLAAMGHNKRHRSQLLHCRRPTAARPEPR